MRTDAEVSQALLVRAVERDNGDEQLKLVLGDRTGSVTAVRRGAHPATSSAARARSCSSSASCRGAQLAVRSLRRARDGEYAQRELHDGPAHGLDQMESDLRELLATIQNPHLRGC